MKRIFLSWYLIITVDYSQSCKCFINGTLFLFLQIRPPKTSNLTHCMSGNSTLSSADLIYENKLYLRIQLCLFLWKSHGFLKNS